MKDQIPLVLLRIIILRNSNCWKSDRERMKLVYPMVSNIILIVKLIEICLYIQGGPKVNFHSRLCTKVALRFSSLLLLLCHFLIIYSKLYLIKFLMQVGVHIFLEHANIWNRLSAFCFTMYFSNFIIWKINIRFSIFCVSSSYCHKW